MGEYTKEFIEYKVAEKFFELLNLDIFIRNGNPDIGEPDIMTNQNICIEIFSVHYSQEVKGTVEYQIKNTGRAEIKTIGPDKMALENLLEGIEKKRLKNYSISKERIILLIDLRELALTTIEDIERLLKGKILSIEYKAVYLFHHNLVVNGKVHGDTKYIIRKIF